MRWLGDVGGGVFEGDEEDKGMRRGKVIRGLEVVK